MKYVGNNPEKLLSQVRHRLALPAPQKRRLIRKKAGISATELASALDCSRQAVRYWEDGQRTPQGDLLVRYAGLLNALEAELKAAHDRAEK